MLYKILADAIVVTHFAWILFMLIGFIFTLYGFFQKGFFDHTYTYNIYCCLYRLGLHNQTTGEDKKDV